MKASINDEQNLEGAAPEVRVSRLNQKIELKDRCQLKLSKLNQKNIDDEDVPSPISMSPQKINLFDDFSGNLELGNQQLKEMKEFKSANHAKKTLSTCLKTTVRFNKLYSNIFRLEYTSFMRYQHLKLMSKNYSYQIIFNRFKVLK